VFHLGTYIYVYMCMYERVETPILIIRVTFPDISSAYYFLLYFPYYVGSLLSQIYLIFFFSLLFFSYINGLD
jgi:hypothetical protein